MLHDVLRAGLRESRTRAFLCALLLLWLTLAGSADAQSPTGHEGHQMARSAPLGISATRDASGTAWAPDATPMSGVRIERGPWHLLHGAAFMQQIAGTGERGARQFGSVNWLMGMAERPAGRGQFTARVMTSVEWLTVGRCGYPNLLQTGETCRGLALHDRQHPHDVFMELVASYRRPLGNRVALEIYGGPAAEPALGPVAYPHRASALPNLFSPISHHWLDATHVTFGVATAGLYGRRWKVEASAFNGREPDDVRYDLDLGPLDSGSTRVWWMPSDRWAIQISTGRLVGDAHGAEQARAVTRTTASITYHRRRLAGRWWAGTLAWGVNREHDAAADALLAEVAVATSDVDTWFVRGELAEKTAEELAIPGGVTSLTVAKAQVGYTRQFARRARTQFGVGASIGLGVVPAAVETRYGRRTPIDGAVFLSMRVK